MRIAEQVADPPTSGQQKKFKKEVTRSNSQLFSGFTLLLALLWILLLVTSFNPSFPGVNFDLFPETEEDKLTNIAGQKFTIISEDLCGRVRYNFSSFSQ
jgi:hypothetical protein